MGRTHYVLPHNTQGFHAKHEPCTSTCHIAHMHRKSELHMRYKKDQAPLLLQDVSAFHISP